MQVQIDHESDVWPYRQLADQLRDAINAGEYPPGRKIPSLVSLVRDSGLAMETVRRAIKVLTDEGLVYTVQGRGTFVSKGDDG